MRFQSRQESGVTVVLLQDVAWVRDDRGALLSLVDRLAGSGQTGLVLDFSQVERVTSAGIEFLVAAKSRFRSRGGRVVLCRVNDRILALLRLTKLIDLLSIAPTVEEAVQACLGDEASSAA
jgi:anti-anti-sigma factor